MKISILSLIMITTVLILKTSASNEMTRQLDDYDTCSVENQNACDNNWVETACCINQYYFGNDPDNPGESGAFCTTNCGYSGWSIELLNNKTIGASIEGYVLGSTGDSGRGECTAYAFANNQTHNEIEDYKTVLTNINTYIKNDNYYSAQTQSTIIATKVELYRKGSCDWTIDKIFHWFVSFLEWGNKMISTLCLQVQHGIDYVIQDVASEVGSVTGPELAPELTPLIAKGIQLAVDAGIDSTPLGPFYEFAKKACKYSIMVQDAEDSYDQIRTDMQQATELNSTGQAMAYAWKETYSILSSINNHQDFYCSNLYLTASLYEQIYDQETYYSFRMGLAAGNLQRDMKACKDQMDNNKDDIVSKYTTFTPSSQRRILDMETVYELPAQDTSSSNNLPKQLSGLTEKDLFEFLQGYYDGQAKLDETMIQDLDIARCLVKSDDLNEFYNVKFKSNLEQIVKYYRSYQLEKTYLSIEKFIKNVDTVLQNNTCFQHLEVQAAATLQEQGIFVNETSNRLWYIDEDNNENNIELTVLVDVVVNLAQDFLTNLYKDINSPNITNHTEPIQLGKFLGMTTKVQANNIVVKEKSQKNSNWISQHYALLCAALLIVVLSGVITVGGFIVSRKSTVSDVQSDSNLKEIALKQLPQRDMSEISISHIN